MELALESIETQRAAMYPGEAHYDTSFFLQYPNGTIYNERQTPGDQFMWNFSVSAARDYYTSSVMSTLANPWVEGSFTGAWVGVHARKGSAPLLTPHPLPLTRRRDGAARRARGGSWSYGPHAC